MNKIFLKILNRTGVLEFMPIFSKTIFYGKKWIIPVIEHSGLNIAQGADDEPSLFYLFSHLVRENKISTFIDAGVNLGQTLIKIKSIDPSVTYYGFEPNTDCVHYVSRLVERNKTEKVRLYPVALGDQCNMMELRMAGNTDTRATLIDEENRHHELPYIRYVPIMPLDEIVLPEINGQVIMKVDVEGYELEVFRGASVFLKKHSPILVFEVLPHKNKNETIEKQGLLSKFLSGAGYRIHEVREDGSVFGAIEVFTNENDLKRTNYLAVKEMRSA